MPSIGATTSWATPSMSTAPSRSPARTRVPDAQVGARRKMPTAGEVATPWRVAPGRRGGSRGGSEALGAAAVARGPRSPSARLAVASPGAGRAEPPRPALAGRRSRTRQSPSRTSSSPRPVAPSLATSAGSSSSVRRAIAAWSAGAGRARRGRRRASWADRASARPPRGPAARRRATTPRARPGRSRAAGLEQIAQAVRRGCGPARSGDVGSGRPQCRRPGHGSGGSARRPARRSGSRRARRAGRR